jgi:hypothetical protein
MTAAAITVLADIPGVGIIKNALGDVAGWGFDQVAEGIAKWVMGAVTDLLAGVVNFLLTAARPDIGAVWFSGPGSPYALVRNIAGMLLLGFVFLAIIQALLAGELANTFGRIVRDLCLSVLGVGATVVVAMKLLELTDAMSTAVLGGADGQTVKFLSGFGTQAAGATGGFGVVLVGLVLVIAAVFIWLELLVRSALVYLLVALMPLAFAAFNWPAARGVLRRTVELLVAVIVSKFVISVALAVGVAALGGAGENGGVAQGLGGLLSGAAILAMAAFAPFLVVKLRPLVEAAAVAQGVSRGRFRAAQTGMSTAFYAQSVARIAGGSQNGSRAASASSPPSTPPSGDGGQLAGRPRGSTPGGAGAATAGVAVAAKVGAAARQRVAQSAEHQAAPNKPVVPPRQPNGGEQ